MTDQQDTETVQEIATAPPAPDPAVDETAPGDDDDLEGVDDPDAPDPGDHVPIDPDHDGDETDPPRDAEDADDDLTDVPEGDVVSADELA